VKLVVNRANSKVGFDVGEVEHTLDMKADCLVPSEIIVPQSVNRACRRAERAALGRGEEHGAACELFLADSRSRRDGR